MPQPLPVVYIVDDDAAVREALAGLMRSVDLPVAVFASAAEFLERARIDVPCCLVLDVRLPGASGLDLQRLLNDFGQAVQIVFITGHGDIPMSVQAMQRGAVDFLPKPFAEQALLDAIASALERDAQSRRRRAELDDLQGRYALLTPRQREVMALVVAGRLNKQAASDLGISEITVKLHRRHVMNKMQAASIAELVRIAETLQSAQAPARTTP